MFATTAPDWGRADRPSKVGYLFVGEEGHVAAALARSPDPVARVGPQRLGINCASENQPEYQPNVGDETWTRAIPGQLRQELLDVRPLD